MKLPLFRCLPGMVIALPKDGQELKEMMNISRTTDIMGDAAYHIMCSDPLLCNGKNFIDDEVLASLDKDVEKYRVNPKIKEKDLMPDFFC